MMTSHTNVWTRIAVHKQNIRSGLQRHWRFFINRGGEALAIDRWYISGTATPGNIVPGSNVSGDPNGLVGWIDLFGSVTVDENGIAQIELKNPSEEA